ncbi:MAG: cytoplasmic protein [Desulfobacterales bacterium]|nr:cytoplasmic protein [Desulfobacterales bacterium]
MTRYTHDFVEAGNELMAFGWDRETNENTMICYLQMFSDDAVMQKLRHRLKDEEIEEIYFLINRLLRTHLNDGEYHRLFLKEPHP